MLQSIITQTGEVKCVSTKTIFLPVSVAGIFDKEKTELYLIKKAVRYMMGDILILLGIIAVWVVLQVYILPKMGIPT